MVRARRDGPGWGDAPRGRVLEDEVTSIVSWLLGAPMAQGNPLDDRYYETASSGSLSRAGVRVTPDTAIKVGAVYRCVSILSNVLAMFPKGMFEHLEKGRRAAPDHPLDPIISFKPNRRQTAFEFWRLICFHLVLRQNAYAQIVQGPRGRGWVGELIPLHPDRITKVEELADGRMRYEYTGPDGKKRWLIGGIDIWHLQGLSQDGLKGLSMMDLASDSIGLSMATERHAARFFGRGVKPTGILQSDRPYKAETAEAMGDSFGRRYGGEDGQGKVPVLWEGMKFESIALNLKDQEFLDGRKFSVSEIARWFGVPPYMIGDVERSTSWGTGIYEQGVQFLVYSLLPWIELLEQSIRYTLVVQPERYYPKFNVLSILRMKPTDQAVMFQILIQNGILNPNECRELLERNPRDGGDEYVDPSKQQPTGSRGIKPPGQMPQQPAPQQRAEVLELTTGESRARALAGARATELLDEEGRAITKLAKEHSKSTDAWRSAIARFYGRFAGRVSATLVCSDAAAKGWCETRRGMFMANGPAVTDAQQDEAVMALTELALANGGI